MRSQSLSEILPQRCCALPFNCFHCPLMTSQFITISFLGDVWGLRRNQLRRSISSFASSTASFASSTASSTSSPASSNMPSSQAAMSVIVTTAARTRAPANRSQRTENFAAFMEPPVVLQRQAQPGWACRALTTQLSNWVVGARSSRCKVRASGPSGRPGLYRNGPQTQIFGAHSRNCFKCLDRRRSPPVSCGRPPRPHAAQKKEVRSPYVRNRDGARERRGLPVRLVVLLLHVGRGVAPLARSGSVLRRARRRLDVVRDPGDTSRADSSDRRCADGAVVACSDRRGYRLLAARARQRWHRACIRPRVSFVVKTEGEEP